MYTSRFPTSLRWSAWLWWMSLLLVAPAMAESPVMEAVGSPLSTKNLKIHEGATDAFKLQHYAHAYGRYMALADQGHLPSARMALLMLQNGSTLFGGEFAATSRQYARWNALVVNAARRDSFVGIEARTTE